MTTLDLSALEADINIAEDVATKLGPLLFLIPGIAPYAAAISAAIPMIVKATNAIEAAFPQSPVGSIANSTAIAAHIDPSKPANPALSG